MHAGLQCLQGARGWRPGTQAVELEWPWMGYSPACPPHYHCMPAVAGEGVPMLDEAATCGQGAHWPLLLPQ